MTRKKLNPDFNALDYTDRVIELVVGLRQEGFRKGKIVDATGISEHRVEVVLRFLNGKGKKPVFRWAQDGTCIGEPDFNPPPVRSENYVRCSTCGGMVSSERSCYLCSLRESNPRGLMYAS